MRAAQGENFSADMSNLLNQVDKRVAQFDQLADAVSELQSFDGYAWSTLRELGRAGSRVYNATVAVQKRMEREARCRDGQRLGLE